VTTFALNCFFLFIYANLDRFVFILGQIFEWTRHLRVQLRANVVTDREWEEKKTNWLGEFNGNPVCGSEMKKSG
jgi:hypothetical protein